MSSEIRPSEVPVLLDDDEVEQLAADLTARIRAAIPSYSSLPYDEHERTVHEHLSLQLRNVASGESPPPRVLRLTSAAARRRAHYGMPVYDVLGAFGVVSAGLWDALRQKHTANESLLVGLVSLLGEWNQAMSQAVVDAYVNESGSRIDRERELRDRLFAILAGSESRHALEDVLSQLAFDLRFPFTVLCWRREPWSLEDMELLQRSGRRWSGVCHVGIVGDQTVLVVQDVDLDELTTRVLEVIGTNGAVGIGLARVGADGVIASLAEAEAAHRFALLQQLPSAAFADHWLECALWASRKMIAPMLQRPMTCAEQSPDLAAAVYTFANSGFSLSGAAKGLHLHPNSVAYRLNRWQELTGLDPRRFSDLVLSLVAIAYAQGDGAPDLNDHPPR
ncbi:PucR family transcriptional regulator [Rhodococcus sp. NPDC127530]|uniref:PucR family transcriptional regulator n=1 Tax=unclassified Rhodococcus (in: high G+C Gram-positive bacteria) TaxID=192944 RepID=UPI00362B1E11